MRVFVIKKTIVFFRSKGELNLAGVSLQVIKILFGKKTEQIQKFEKKSGAD